MQWGCTIDAVTQDLALRAGDEDNSGAALENRAKASYLARDYRAAINAFERAYTAYRREGDLLAAARAAHTVAWFHGSLYGEWAVYAGWVRRSLSLLEEVGDDGAGHGWVLLAQAQAGNDLEQQRGVYLAAIAAARVGRDRPGVRGACFSRDHARLFGLRR